MTKKIHFIGIGGIGISALARYYVSQGWYVTGSDSVASTVTQELEAEGIQITIGEDAGNVDSVDKAIYTEAIMDPDGTLETTRQKHPELDAALIVGIPTLTYPEGLGEVFNEGFGIAVTGTHGKSTTTTLLGLIWQQNLHGTIITGTKVPQFGNTNFFTQGEGGAIVIEACEYKRHFLHYHPEISVITNAEVDHLDYYQGEEDYLDAFQTFIDQTKRVTILTGNDPGCQKLKDESKIQIWVYDDHYEVTGPETAETGDIENDGKIRGGPLPRLEMKVPGKHILHDAHLAYLVGKLLQVPEDNLVKALESYVGAWRRMEIVGGTPGGNLIMSDYGHHPTEIELTLGAIKEYHPDKHLYVIFQPHQYSRTIELLDGFKTCFDDADTLLVPDIYYSRDSKKDVAAMPPEKFVEELSQNYPDVINGEGLQNASKIVLEHDQNNEDVLYLILGAGDVDNMRFYITNT